MHMPVYALGDRVPAIDPSAFVHPDAVIIGSVVIGPESSIWPCAVLRGDGGSVVIGARTSVQDGCVVHCTSELDTTIGDDCVIGHLAHLEGCTVADRTLIGSGSIILHRAVVGPDALVGAGALVTNGMTVPPNARALGVPARITADVIENGAFSENVDTYVRKAHQYAAQLRRMD
jgi:carbonic anhydrase/acetyltransferase-like protein (isoleucine patch superfamily)